MIKQNPCILLMTRLETISLVFANTLTSFFGNRLNIIRNHMQERLHPSVYDAVDLILVSDTSLLHDQPALPSDIPVLLARRTIDINKLDQLMDLPPGTRCLFVSNSIEMVDGAIELLFHLGFSHLTFIPYVPDTETPLPEKDQIDVAVCHGLRELIPTHFENVIELGHRPLDLTTIFDISRLLDLSPDKANLYTADFISDFVHIGRKLTNSVHNERKLNEKLSSILNAVHEGIIGTDATGNITVLNKEAEKILHMTEATCIGRNIAEVIPEFHILEVVESHTEVTKQVLEFRDLYLLVTKIPTFLDDQFLGAVITFQDVTKVQQIEQEIRTKSANLGLMTKYSFDNIIGKSTSIQANKRVATKLAESDFTILITGENGTGKEVFAQAIHHHSTRRDGPFVPVNFAGLTESLVESELFGYEEGSFTGARKGGKMGLFELAHNGTIFLDEIGDAPLSIQAALLRVLQEKQVMRVGGYRVIPVNVRVIAATNCNLMEMVKKGTFREDLYYRLNVLPLHIQPLRDRPDDILVLIDYFLQKKKQRLSFSREVTEQLLRYDWPGNIRELENFIHYAVVIAEGNQVELAHLPERFFAGHVSTSPLLSHRDDTLEDTIRYLSRQGSLVDYTAILQVLSDCYKRQERTGRSALLARMNGGPSMTEAQIRHKLTMLDRAGCVSIGVKKQGTQITAFGQQVLEALLSKNKG
ncbi:transcriptional regulator [Brevibacillus brevis]|uniref:sigma-54 interaction domain-containing protein n=1 Tax=Brevibacillus brevis TaxID=1393 RepID=UPI00190299C1|nr:sigma 54-interacting transcriptional regulator [Brevibacillus brevis]MBH0329803.1 transcriptional regulator [Brevibacillus brevis]